MRTLLLPILATSLLLAACDRPAPPAAAKVVDPASVVTVTYRVEGMHCDGCANAIRQKVSGLAGVVACEVTYEGGQATISIADASVTPSVEGAITSLGYSIAPADAAPSETPAPAGEEPGEAPVEAPVEAPSATG